MTQIICIVQTQTQDPYEWKREAERFEDKMLLAVETKEQSNKPSNMDDL